MENCTLSIRLAFVWPDRLPSAQEVLNKITDLEQIATSSFESQVKPVYGQSLLSVGPAVWTVGSSTTLIVAFTFAWRSDRIPMQSILRAIGSEAIG